MPLTLNGLPVTVPNGLSLNGGSKGTRNGIAREVSLNGYSQRLTWNGARVPPLSSPGSVLYFPGMPGQGSKIYDYSGDNNHGTIYGATWERLPSGLMVLSFDSIDDTAIVLDSASLRLTANLHLHFWFKPISFSGGYPNPASKTGAGGMGWQVLFNGVANPLTWRFSLDGVLYQGAVSQNVTYGTWQCVDAVRDGTTSTLYLNAVAASVACGAGAIDGAVGGNLLIAGGSPQAQQQTLQSLSPQAPTADEVSSRFERERHLLAGA